MKNTIFYFFTFLLIAFSSLAYSQTPKWINYTHSTIVTAFAKEGNLLWIGTDKGLISINQLTGEKKCDDEWNSGLPNNRVISIAIDKAGNKWIGSYCGEGIAKFDETNWTV
jgi:ligand-binding sensor domain-containing protein